MKYILFVGEIATKYRWYKISPSNLDLKSDYAVSAGTNQFCTKAQEKGLSDLQNLIQSGWKNFAQPANPVGQKTLSSAF